MYGNIPAKCGCGGDIQLDSIDCQFNVIGDKQPSFPQVKMYGKCAKCGELRGSVHLKTSFAALAILANLAAENAIDHAANV